MQSIDNLIGKTLPAGWKVIDRASRKPNATGGCFSYGFIVERQQDQTKAFLKVVNYSRALQHPDTALALNELTNAFLFERQLCERCRAKKLRRVVHAIDSGKYVDASLPFGFAEYLVFELADGDVRAHLDALIKFDVAWALRALHHLVTAIWQLHRNSIAHQDIKPSNLLVFDKVMLKVADLGRASSLHQASPYDGVILPGDPDYAPPELLFQHLIDPWERRVAADLYHVGNMMVFLFTRSNITAMMIKHLGSIQSWYTQGMPFKDALPYLVTAFDAAVEEFKRALPAALQSELPTLLRELCYPNPALRGHPANRSAKGNRYSLERYVSRFNVLASAAELDMLKG